MKIEITQQDIDNSMKDHVSGCAIALGLKQEFAYEISVSASGWICIGKDHYLRDARSASLDIRLR